MTRMFDTLSDALSELGWERESAALETMKKAWAQKLYFVAFVGQYSAGKSCLINNLLHRELLPRSVTETTPLLTYIRYGESERALLHRLDESVQTIALEQISSVVQGNTDWDIEDLNYLEIYLPAETLRNGMVLLDTPGINTLIERHEQLFASSLALAAKIVYVAGHAPGKVDKEQISALVKQGFDVSFVRTHCDEIKESEENDVQAIEADMEIISAWGLPRESCYHISNLPDSRWFSHIEPLGEMLMDCGAHAEDALEEAFTAQCRALAVCCRDALVEKQRLLDDIRRGNEAELTKKENDISSRISALNASLSERKNRLQAQIDACDRALAQGGSVRRKFDAELEEACERIADKAETLPDTREMKGILRAEGKRCAGKAIQYINEALDPAIKDINADFDVDSMTAGDLPGLEAENFSELALAQDMRYQEMRQQLLTLKADGEKIEAALEGRQNSPEYQALCADLIAMEKAAATAREECEGMPPYSPQYIEVEDSRMQPSQVGRMIGNIADWALLFMPGVGAGKAVEGLLNSQAVLKPLAKMIGGAEKAAKIVKKGDSIKDTVFALQHMSKTYATQKRMAQASKFVGNTVQRIKDQNGEDTGNFLDMLSVAHWTEKIGAAFDRPPQMVLDKAYDAEYHAARDRVVSQMRTAQQNAYQKKRELGLFESESERLRAEKKAAQVDEAKVAAELQRREQDIRKTAQRKARECWADACCTLFETQMRQQFDGVLQRYRDEVPKQLEAYQTGRIADLQQQLERERQAFAELRATPPGQAAEDLKRVDTLLHNVEELLA